MSRRLRVMIVEDEVLVAVELAWLVEEAGHEVVAQAITAAEALDAVRDQAPDLALVDVHLQDGATGVSLARTIAETAHAMVLFMTANQKRVPDDFAGAAGIIAKPYTSHGVQEAIGYVAQCLEHGCAGRPAPHSLHVAPAFRDDWAAPVRD